MFCTPARLGRRHASSPRSGPSRSRIPSWMWLSARKHSTAFTVPSRSNRPKTSRITAWTCSSGSRATSPEGRRTKPAGSGTASSPRRALASRPVHIRCLIRCSSASYADLVVMPTGRWDGALEAYQRSPVVGIIRGAWLALISSFHRSSGQERRGVVIAKTKPCWARVTGPLAPYAGGFRAELERLGYTPLTAATHVRLMAHLSRWLAAEGVEASGMTPAAAGGYFADRRAAGYAGSMSPPWRSAAARLPAAARRGSGGGAGGPASGGWSGCWPGIRHYLHPRARGWPGPRPS